MKAASKDLKKAYKKINIDKIEKMQDDMFDLMADAEEINEMMSRSYTTPDYIDEDDLDAELAALGDDLAVEDSSYLDEDISVPKTRIDSSASKSTADKDLERELGLL